MSCKTSDDDDSSLEFNVFASDDFLLEELAADDLARIEICSSGVIGSETVDERVLEITEAVQLAANTLAANLKELVDDDDHSFSPISSALSEEIRGSLNDYNNENENFDDDEDEHGFTEADYEILRGGGDFTFALADDNGELPAVADRRYAKITDFPLNPGEMTFEFCHEFAMLCAGRKRDLEDELRTRLQFDYNSELYERHFAQNGVVDQKDIAYVKELLLNEKLETYAKLGLIREIETLNEENEGSLDFCQRDKCGVTLIGRLCVWPCHPAHHSQCRAIRLLATRCPDKYRDVNLKSNLSRTSALMIAARVGELCKVQALLASGAYVNDVDSEARSALILAAERGRSDIVDALLSRGANPAPIRSDIRSAANAAAENGYDAVHDRIAKYSWNLSSALRRLGERLVGEVIEFRRAVTPVLCLHVREGQTFLGQFSIIEQQQEEEEEKEGPPAVGKAVLLANLLFITCIQRDARGRFRCRKSDNIESVLVNGIQQESLMQKTDAINIYSLLNLRRDHNSNWLRIQFKEAPASSPIKVLVQAFSCDMSGVLSRRPACHEVNNNTDHNISHHHIPVIDHTPDFLIASSNGGGDLENIPPSMVPLL